MARARVYEQKRMFKYPHLLSEDAEIWERFIDAFPGFFERVEYDVHVGLGVEKLPGWTDQWHRVANDLSNKRIDVVGWKDGKIWLVELKPYAGLGALGQVIGYELLYKQKERPAVELVKVIVTDVATSDLRYLAERLGVRVYTV